MSQYLVLNTHSEPLRLLDTQDVEQLKMDLSTKPFVKLPAYLPEVPTTVQICINTNAVAYWAIYQDEA
ncbi:hypothetical protein [Arthrobacter sp. Hiyo1]|uniref:hypothetical protein n=1 Tax=Arthrobacter sp. Hiyo1 TaxID=1588020 RepID=UPI0007513D21|nr:hypothetical protein [Arthrobacter sp. Hiyo1]